MKKLILVRLFAMNPDPRVTNVLGAHMSQTIRPVFIPTPGAMITVFETESDQKEIEAQLKQLGVFFVLGDLQTISLVLPNELMAIIRPFTNDAVANPDANRQWTLDELLDLISMSGRESLTPEQLTQLQRLTA
jgi:hypothetical protein